MYVSTNKTKPFQSHSLVSEIYSLFCGEILKTLALNNLFFALHEGVIVSGCRNYYEFDVLY